MEDRAAILPTELVLPGCSGIHWDVNNELLQQVADQRESCGSSEQVTICSWMISFAENGRSSQC